MSSNGQHPRTSREGTDLCTRTLKKARNKNYKKSLAFLGPLPLSPPLKLLLLRQQFSNCPPEEPRRSSPARRRAQHPHTHSLKHRWQLRVSGTSLHSHMKGPRDDH